jgi:tRNA A-37 threonylcarbamoyl transferase component Bud32
MLIVEWIDPEDPAIQFFKHLDWNQEVITGAFTLEAFETALEKYFKKYDVLGDISPSRKIYLAFKHTCEIDLSGPLPLLFPKESIISSRLLAKVNGIDYWSRVYDWNDRIYKQATLDLATREGHILQDFSSPYFPRVLSIQDEDQYSVISMEKIQGTGLADASDDICSSSDRFIAFVNHGLNVLDLLADGGIVHRDIRMDNLMVRDGLPVLIDFGWAVSEQMPYFIPPGLGAAERPVDGSFSDVYSLGKVLKNLNKDRFPQFGPVIDLMIQDDQRLRISDVQVIRTLFRIVSGSQPNPMEQ